MEDIDVMAGVDTGPASIPEVSEPTGFEGFNAREYGGVGPSSDNYSQNVMHPFNRRRFALDGNHHVVFREGTKYNLQKSEAQGRPVYDAVDRVKIISPGNKLGAIDRVARRSDIDRFPRQYEAYKRKQPQMHGGTPLKAWFAVSPAQIAELNYFEVHTVEQLAGISDDVITRMGPGYTDLRKRAAEWSTKVTADEKDSEVQALRKQLAELAAKVEFQQGTPEPEPQKRRRRTKAEMEADAQAEAEAEG